MPRLAVTRPQEQLGDLARQAADRGIEVVPLPVIATRPFAFMWPEALAPESISWILFSSANAVDAFFFRAGELDVHLPASIRLGAVGEKTAEAVKAHGRAVSFVPSSAYGQFLFEEFVEQFAKPGDCVMYARARDVNYDPAPILAARGISYYPVICYETISRPVDPALVLDLAPEDYILFTAPSAVRAFHEQFGRPKARPIAIGRSTGSEMNRHGWIGIRWMNTPVIESVLEYL